LSVPSRAARAARRARPVVCSVLAVAIAALAGFGASAASADAGRAQFMRHADTAFDTFTASPTAAQAEWMRTHYWRMRAFAPYFDSRLGWSPKAWVYQSAYAIYTGGDVARDHPEWILRDAAGNKLYIPFGCKNGTCPQYAADIGNPAFRSYWISEARARLARGYAGVYIDDVNLYRKVGNGAGQEVAPIDPRTNAVMTEPVWQRYLADHMAGVRAAFPTTEIVHNAIWYAGETTPDQLRQLRAADLINLERGVNDAGLTGGTGKWGLQRLLAYADHRHAEGHGVVFDGRATTDAGRLYNLAAYLLVSSGRDGIGNDAGGTPADWWKGYDVDLGAPLGARYLSGGVIRRDFKRGFALVNEPGTPTRTISLPVGARDLTGATRTRVSLAPASGAVFVTAAPPVASTSATFTVPPTQGTAAAAPAHRSGAGAGPASGAAPAPTTVVGSALTLKVTVLPAARAASRRAGVRGRAVRISGRLRGDRGGRVQIAVRRTGGRALARVRQHTRKGRFARVLRRVRPGTYRVVVSYRPRTAGAAAKSVVRRFQVPRQV
jgi:hypothetical protein